MSGIYSIHVGHDPDCSCSARDVVATAPTVVGVSTWPFRGFVSNPILIAHRYSCRHGSDLPLPCAECHRVVP